MQIMSQLKHFLQKNTVVSFFDLTLHFKIDPNILRSLLQLWINKGKLRKTNKTESCGTKCTKCSPFVREIYEWIE